VTLSDEQGYGSADETDFLKPNQQFPSVDGKRSVQVYLARMREAVEDYESVAGEIHPDDFVYAPFHTPFPGMVRKAALLAYRHITRDTEIEEALAEEIGMQPREAEFDGEEAFLDAVGDYTDKLKETTRYQEWYEATIDPTLDIARHVGNWYTGSVHVARLAALKRAHEAGREMTDERLFVARRPRSTTRPSSRAGRTRLHSSISTNRSRRATTSISPSTRRFTTPTTTRRTAITRSSRPRTRSSSSTAGGAWASASTATSSERRA
jgi:hypothetical protein